MEMDTDKLLERIQSIMETKFDKFESDIKASISELKDKVDIMNDRQSNMSERTNALELKVCEIERSKADQGKRMGDLEKDFVTFKTEVITAGKTKVEMMRGTSDWVRWVPSFIFGIFGATMTILMYLSRNK